MFVERCWICLEQPAAQSVHTRDGRDYPVCDICALEQAPATTTPATTPAGSDAVSDEAWANIVEDLK
jgi:hypothetical protein